MVFKYLPTHLFDKNKNRIHLLKFIFEDNTLRFSSPLSFNDPFELKPHITEIINEENHLVVDMFSSQINNSGQANKFYQMNINNLLKDIGILSLSKNNDNLTMWAHYSDNHAGIVIEFDDTHKFFYTSPKEAELLYGLEKVNYLKERPNMNSAEWAINKKTFLTKNVDWEYEDEWRMAVLLDEFDTDPNKYNIKFPPELIRSIYIGCRANSDTVEYIKNLKNQEKWQHLNIYKFLLDDKEYKLISKDIK